jgi:KDEL-tailed cysteine endopeptidase
MKSLLVILALCVVAAAAFREEESQWMFTKWIAQHKKAYPMEHFFARFNIFKQNVEFINQKNNENNGYTLAVNEFADLTLQEFVAAKMKLDLPMTSSSEEKFEASGSAPAEVDWRTSGAVAPVKDQGQCGSCWAFSAIGAIESRCFIKEHPATIENLSEQQLVDCSTSYGNQGCNGGWMDYAFQYAIDNKGVATTKDYPYKAVDQKCKTVAGRHCAVASFKDVTENDENALMEAVAEGPVSVAIEADTSVFQFYSSGVLDSAACGTQLDHGVLAVGYGTMSGKKMWIVKNSWGSSWGQKGYIYLARNVADKMGTCGIAEKPSFPVF